MATELAFPLSLFRDPKAYSDWQAEVGKEEAGRQINEACRAHMEKHGVRSIIEVVEEMDNCIARLAEFSDVDLGGMEDADREQ